MTNTIYGLVLAGGTSSRMGKPKGLIRYHDKPQQEYLFDLLKNFCGKVFTSCKKKEDIPEILNPFPDAFEINTPLNGILTALSFNKDVCWLTVPVDMPLIDSTSIEFLIKNRNPSKVATCYLDSGGSNPEPLFTLWEPSAQKPMMDYYKNGGVSPREFLKKNPIQTVKIPDASILLNINSEEELKRFLQEYGRNT